MKRILAICGVLALFGGVSVALGAPAVGTSVARGVYFVGDFDTCDFSQWKRQGAESSFEIVRTAAGRSCAAAVRVGPQHRGGLVNQQSDGAALFLDRAAYGTAGKTVWQRFSIRFAPGFKSTAGDWNWITEWHNDSDFLRFVDSRQLTWEYANLCWNVRNLNGVERLGMRIMGGRSADPTTIWVNGPKLRTGHWYDFLVRTVWSPDPSRGSVTWWLDGKKLYSGRAATLYRRPDGSVSSVYFMQGYYRLHAGWEATVLYDDTRLGATRASVPRRS